MDIRKSHQFNMYLGNSKRIDGTFVVYAAHTGRAYLIS